jgi:hypothetical protein
MASKPAQTPGVWTLKPDSDTWSEQCELALKACGIDPGSFGSYSERQSAARKARAALPDWKDVDPSTLSGNQLQNYLSANSEAGHMVPNSIFQHGTRDQKDRRVRDDPCMNHPPSSNSPGASSAYGYTCSGAPCTDHYGSSTMRGSCHAEVTHGSEAQQIQNPETGGVDAAGMRDQAQRTAEVHASTNRDQSRAKPENATKIEQLANAQEQNAARLSGANPTPGQLGAASPVDPSSPAQAGSPGPSKTVQEIAAECEAAFWEKSMAAMRARAVNNSPAGRAAAAENGGTPFTSLTPAQQQEFLERRGGEFFGTPPPAPRAGSNIAAPPAPPEPQGRHRRPPSGRPTANDCLVHQGNHLAWQTANNNGTPPPWGGTMPGNSTPIDPNVDTPASIDAF